MNKKLSKKDKEDWLKFVKGKQKLLDKENLNFQHVRNLEKTIDLHGYSLNEANQIIEKYIVKCFSENIVKINIITGKGNRSKNQSNPYKSENLSILKHSVPEFIKTNHHLMKMIKKISYNEIDNNSKGSFEIYLKKIKE